MTGALGWLASVGWLAIEPEDARPGYGALLLVLGLAVVTFLLWRSMNTQLGKIQMPPSQSPGQSPGQSPSEAARGSEGVPGSDVDQEDDDGDRPPAPRGD